MWSDNLVLLACAAFLLSCGEGLVRGSRTNFFVDTVGLSGGQVLWLEGIREIPGLGLMFLAALTMHLPLSRRAAASVLLLGIGYGLYALVHSYTALIAVALVASLGMHGWMPLYPALGMCLTTKERSGRLLGALRSVGALASIVGMGLIALTSRLFETLSLRFSYVAGGIIIVLAALLLFKLPKNIGATDGEQPRMLIKRRYWLFYVLTFFEGSRKQVLGTFGALMLVDSYGFKVWQISTLLLVSSILSFFTAPGTGYLIDRFGERKMLSISYVGLVLCCAGYASVQNAWLLVGLLIAIKLLTMLGMGLPTYVNRMAPVEELTPTLSAGISINHVTSVAMPLIAGILLPIIGYSGIWWLTAGLIALSVPFALALKVSTPLAPRVNPAMAE